MTDEDATYAFKLDEELNKIMNNKMLDVIKTAVPSTPVMSSSSVASTSLTSGNSGNSWPNSIYTTTGSGYIPAQSWIPQCAHCLSQDKYAPAVTLIDGDAVCTDCAKQALNIIVED